MPVGRFVLDVHGEAASTWPANDALCAALQVINHLQDCGKDYRDLDRVYLPLDALAADGRQRRGAGGAAAPRRRCARRSQAWPRARRRCSSSRGPSPAQIADRRLALEVGVIQRLAERLAAGLDAPRSAVASASIISVEAIGLALRWRARRRCGRLGASAVASRLGARQARR